ncbi:uncharacterized protein LOC141816741 [Curcuma longa]|uniref:uncharacterized protein LOC141816741 n=1 Tax=Curcuma longa TaxID=136217 RepID=UPI003D9DD537
MTTVLSSASLAVLSSNPRFPTPSSSSTKLQIFSHQDHLSFSFPARLVVSPAASTNHTVRIPPPSAIVSPAVTASMSAADADEGKMKQLISVITGHLASLGDGLEDLSSSPRDALRMVDVIERLGIQRFFQEQIHRIIRLSYLRWHEQLGFHDDADATLLGFRLLRLFGYHVTAVIAGDSHFTRIHRSEKAAGPVCGCSRVEPRSLSAVVAGRLQPSSFIHRMENFSWANTSLPPGAVRENDGDELLVAGDLRPQNTVRWLAGETGETTPMPKSATAVEEKTSGNSRNNEHIPGPSTGALLI